MSEDFVRRQQKVIDADIRTMSEEQINEILEHMNQREVDRFLERLGRIRARVIYDSYED